MKLNYKKVILVGFAFFIITAFWQSYDKSVRLFLSEKFDLSETLSGFIMALDNILAIFLLPLFGSISDKTKTRFGRRTPFIVLGTIGAVIFYIFIPLINSLPLFIVSLLLVLLCMATFRSPAVALMPDVTCKPHRSKANAIINLVGTAGGMIVLVFGIIFGGTGKGADFMPYYIAVSGLMLLGLVIFVLTVKEPKWAKEMQEDSETYFSDKEAEERAVVGGKLSRSQLISLLFILASVFMWYMGYNAITSAYSDYAQSYLKMSYDITLIVAQVAAIISYIPVGLLAGKIGRKKTIIIGVALLFLSFLAASFIKEGDNPAMIYILFALAGIAWATINVNSFPMVVELSKNSDIGKYTGYYYMASMAAQVITPVLSGAFVDFNGWAVLFPYAAICTAIAFVTMVFVRHGDSMPNAPVSKLEMLGSDD